MKLLENILLAVDFVDKDNQSLIDTAAYLSKVFNSSIVAINIIPEKTDNKEVSQYLMNYANENMEKLEAELAKKGVDKLSTHVLSGSPFDKIMETAEKEDFNVILAGSGKKGEINKPGVTIRKLIRKTSVPVWVVKQQGTIKVNNIICPVDFSEASKRALSNAILLASKMNARLRVVSVYDPIELVSRRIAADLDDYNKKALTSYKEQFNDFLNQFDFNGLDHKIETLVGKPENIILEQLHSKNFDLLLMGTTGKTGLSRILIGSVTEEVIEDCPISFITTKNRDILNPEFEMKVVNIESLIRKAEEHMKEGDFNRAAMLYEKCMGKDDLFLPAIAGASLAFEKAGNQKKARQYDQYAKEIASRLWKKDILKKYLK